MGCGLFFTELGQHFGWCYHHWFDAVVLIHDLQAFQQKDVGAWEDFLASREGRPYPVPEVSAEGEGLAKQRELEEKYFSGAALEKYRK